MEQILAAEKLASAREALFQFVKDHINPELENIRSTVKSFDVEGYQQKKDREFKESRTVIDRFIESGLFHQVTRFDLFRLLRVQLSENQISDVVEAALNPAKSILGKSAILSLLMKAEEISTNQNLERIRNIVFNTPESRFFSKRECSGTRSRIDIRIMTKNPERWNNAIIDFEMKVAGGIETLNCASVPQTLREWDDLRSLADRMGVCSNNVAAFFVSPSGKAACSENFISLPISCLNEILTKELLCLKDGGKSKIGADGIGALLHFFNSRYVF